MIPTLVENSNFLCTCKINYCVSEQAIHLHISSIKNHFCFFISNTCGTMRRKYSQLWIFPPHCPTVLQIQNSMKSDSEINILATEISGYHDSQHKKPLCTTYSIGINTFMIPTIHIVLSYYNDIIRLCGCVYICKYLPLLVPAEFSISGAVMEP